MQPLNIAVFLLLVPFFIRQGISKNSEFAQMQGAEKISPRRI